MSKPTFQVTVRKYYQAHGRHDLPWRAVEPGGGFDPYKIMVSELMLQQTQVSRVVPKYQEFLAVFPTISSLAEAPLADVLRAWSGLGYNRRAKFLHQAARRIMQEHNGEFPRDIATLRTLPGIGPNTAGNPNRQARQYAKQSKFEGSRRQITDQRLGSIIDELLQEGLITRSNRYLTL